MAILVAPSLLAADFGFLANDIHMVNESEADWIHVDIMDGQFVPNLSMGFPVVKAIQRHARKPLDVHLMVVQPERFVERFADAGAAVITVHVEACIHLHRTVQQIKELGLKAGVAVNPHTPVSDLEWIIGDVDVVNLMSVNPGFGGQRLIEATFDKVKQTRDLIGRTGSRALIEIDGGVNISNAPILVQAGADVLVAGQFVFGAEDPADVIRQLKAMRA